MALDAQANHEAPARRLFFLDLNTLGLPFVRDNLASLPCLRHLLGSGRYVEPESTANIMSGGTWPTFAAAALPGEHGIYYPMQWDATSMSPRRLKDEWANFDTFWRALARSGVRTVVLDPTQVLPAPDSPCIEIINWSGQSSSRAFSTRPDLLREIRSRFGDNPIGDEIAAKKSRALLNSMRDALKRSLKRKFDAALWLLEQLDWQLAIVSVLEPHRAGHNLWPIWGASFSDPPPDALLEVIKELDRQLDRFLNAIDLTETLVVIFSLGGMGPNRAQSHFLPAVMNRANALYASHAGWTRSARPQRNIMRPLRRVLPDLTQYWIRRLVTEEAQDWVVAREFSSGYDWPRTPAVAVPSGGEGFIRLNIKGRESAGCLSTETGEVDHYVDFLTRQLRALRVSETEEPLVDRIVPIHDAFPGANAERLPDLGLIWRPDRPATEIWSPELGPIRARLRTGRGGNHTNDSFAIFTGATAGVDRLPPVRHIIDYGRFANAFFSEAAVGSES